MVSIEKISHKLFQLDGFLDTVQKISESPIESFINDRIPIGSAKYYLQVSIKCCLDIANHVIAAERFRPPREYADTFKVLEEQGVIDSDLCMKLGQMAKFRNRLVSDIDNAAVHSFIEAGIYRTETIRVAEAAKVIENTQRDLNIALMNELAIIFEKMGLDTVNVLKAAGTKWILSA